MSGYIPCYNLNGPYRGLQGPPLQIAPDTIIYSSYTSQPIWTGPMPYGIPTDALEGTQGYGKNFHVIEVNPIDNSHMAHRLRKND